MGVCGVLVWMVRALLLGKSTLVAENLALRQQLTVLRRQSRRPKLKRRDRLFWVLLSKIWNDWRSSVLIVQPGTVIKWHRQGFRLYWRWKSRGRTGRPQIPVEARRLIREMATANSIWGVGRIKSELALLGYDIAESTVARYVPRNRRPPSPTWKTFLKNHAADIVAMDFFVVPTVTFRLLYVFIMLRHSDRKILYFDVTPHPTAVWTAQQIRNTFPYESAPRFILRDRDGIYGHDFQRTVRGIGIEEVKTAPRSPWQNAYAERVIGTLGRECTDQMIVLNERQLLRALPEYVAYYNETRPHLSLNRNAPTPRKVDLPENGKIVATPILGGLHHRYRRVA